MSHYGTAHAALYKIGVFAPCIFQNRHTRIHHGGLVPEFHPLAVVQVLARAVYDHNRRQWRRGAKPYSCSWKLNPEISPGGYFAFAYLSHPMINCSPHDRKKKAAKPLFFAEIIRL